MPVFYKKEQIKNVKVFANFFCIFHAIAKEIGSEILQNRALFKSVVCALRQRRVSLT